MLRSLQILCLSLTALCLAAVLPLSASRAEAKDRDIKVTGVDDKYLNLEVDGKKVNIPLPEGYEVAEREPYDKLYKRLERGAAEVNKILLCVLVNSGANIIKRNNSSYLGYKYCLFTIENRYKKMIVSGDVFQREIKRLKEFSLTMAKDGNQQLINEKLSPFTCKTIFENEFSFSEINIEDWAIQGEYRIGFTETYFNINNIMYTFLMYYDIRDIEDIESLTRETISYIDVLGKR